MASSFSVPSPSKDCPENTSINAPSKSRKPSYVTRKETKNKLLSEIAALQTRLEALHDAQRQLEAEARLKALKLRESSLENQLATHVLRETIKLKQLALVNLQSAISAYMSSHDAIPHQIPLVLNVDQKQRRRTLFAFRHRNMASALDYLMARTQYLDPFRPFADNLQSLSEAGDYCALYLSAIPLEGSRVSVKQVFDTVVGHLSDMEMRITDVVGDVTTRDDIDYGIEGLQQSRFVSQLLNGAQLEMNTVMNWEFSERSDQHGGGHPFGLVTINSVERDDLYPYQPQNRVRFDISMVMSVRAHTRERLNESTRRWEQEHVVVWTRARYTKLRPTLEPLPILTKHQLRGQLGKWGEDMERAVMEQVLPSTQK